MKILHTSDWHLGKRLGPYPRLEEQREVLEEILTLCDREEPDLVIVAGDLFDTFNPPTEAVELLYRTLKRITRGGRAPVVALAGNHDSPERIEAPDPLARECGIFFLGYPDTLPPETILESGVRVSFPEPGILVVDYPHLSYPVRLLGTPYANETRLRRSLGEGDREASLRSLLQERWAGLAERHCDASGVNLLAGHFFAAPRGDLFTQEPEEPEGERPILHPGGLELIHTDNFPPQVQYVALGHLHKPQQLSGGPCPVVYSGTPLAYSLSEREQDKEVVLVEGEPARPVKISRLSLNSGRRIFRRQFSGADEALEWLKENPLTYVEILLETADFIKGETKRLFYDTHDGILALIPILPEEDSGADRSAPSERDRSVPELFEEYFKASHQGIAPGEDLMGLLRELLSLDEEE